MEEPLANLSLTKDQCTLLILSLESMVNQAHDARNNLREQQIQKELPEGITHEEIIEELNITLHIQKESLELIDEVKECLLFLASGKTESGIIIPPEAG